MPKIVVIDKTGTVKTVSIKDFAENTLYKKVGFKSGDGFILQHTWGADDGLDQSIKLYAKKTGKAGQENKYDFPPPVDEVLFFGSCALVGSDLATGKIVDLTEDDWEEIYEFLFGGFEDLGSEDPDSDEDDIDTDDELETIQKTTGVEVKQTKQGYAKDGFIVDDDEVEDADYTEDDSDESEKTPPKKLLVKGRKPATKTPVPVVVSFNAPKSHLLKNSDLLPYAKSVNPIVQSVVSEDLQIDDCESELSEESYV